MVDDSKILECIYNAIDEINETLPPDRKVAKGLAEVLYGTGGPVDSLTLTLLIVALERQIEQKLSVSISLVDQTDSTNTNNAFSDIETLKRHIEALVKKTA